MESDAVVDPGAAVSGSPEKDPLNATSALLLEGADATMIGPSATNFEGYAAIDPQVEEKASAQAAAVTSLKN